MTYNELLQAGAKEIEPIEIRQGREKSYGRMWDGEALLELNGIQFKFDIWFHAGNDPIEALNEIKSRIEPSAIMVNDKYYDSYWYTVMNSNGIWLHEVGWFKDPQLSEQIRELRAHFDPEKAKELGLHKVV